MGDRATSPSTAPQMSIPRFEAGKGLTHASLSNVAARVSSTEHRTSPNPE